MCVMVMDKMVAMKLIAPITLVRWLLSDYHLCRQRNDIVWEVCLIIHIYFHTYQKILIIKKILMIVSQKRPILDKKRPIFIQKTHNND